MNQQPVRAHHLPYGRQTLDESDIQAVVAALRSDWLTTGPLVERFERAFAEFVGASEAVAVSNGTAALHAAMFAAGVGPGDEVIVPALTFVATANAAVYQGGKPVFVDVCDDNLLIDVAEVERKLTERTRAVVCVDYAGHPCDYDPLLELVRKHRLILIADACHAPGALYKGRKVGTLADLNTFSAHPVKHFTTGEGGLITTNDTEMAARMRIFRNHGIDTDHRLRQERGTFHYEMQSLGYNYRITDFQCALGESQLQKLPQWVHRRRQIARRYDAFFQNFPLARPLVTSPDVEHAYHLYVIRLDLGRLKADRRTIFSQMRAEGIGVNVHYLPVPLHPYYRETFQTRPGGWPRAEAAYEELLSLPIFPGMSDQDVDDVTEALTKVLTHQGSV